MGRERGGRGGGVGSAGANLGIDRINEGHLGSHKPFQNYWGVLDHAAPPHPTTYSYAYGMSKDFSTLLLDLLYLLYIYDIYVHMD